MLLAIDAGNTKIKWGLFDANGFMHESGACFHHELRRARLPASSKTMVSNVAGKNIEDILETKLPVSTPITWVKPQAKALGLTNGYDKPETLGTDRWASIIGAWQQHKLTSIVISAGTTITIDAIIAEGKGAKHIGGMILPGLHLMQKSLAGNTAQLSDFTAQAENEKAYNTDVGTYTEAAIQHGVMSAVIGAIQVVVNRLQAQTQQTPFMIFSGGDAHLIQQHFTNNNNITSNNSEDNPMIIIDNLVLLGLFALSNEQ